MVSQIVKEENSYEAAFRALRSEPSDARVSWLDRLRERAMDRFEQVGFPSVKEEEWKYTNVAAIARTGFSPVVSGDTPSAVT